MSVKQIRNKGIIVPAGIMSVPQTSLRFYKKDESIVPTFGMVVYGKVISVGQHSRITTKANVSRDLLPGTRIFAVYGTRYATDYFHVIVPGKFAEEVDLVSAGGIIGTVTSSNQLMKQPTRIQILGVVCHANGNPIMTTDYRHRAVRTTSNGKKKPKLILVVGGDMNSGKTKSAAAIVRTLSTNGKKVVAAKLTGSAAPKDIQLMYDHGAFKVFDFTHLGYPSTYLLSNEKLLENLEIFEQVASNTNTDYFVVEIADGILQRETSYYLSLPVLKQRIHKLVFASTGTLGAIAGCTIIQEKFGLVPDAISGVISSAPLALEELRQWSQIPTFSNLKPNRNDLFSLLE
ncbi:MAG: hypothetical protein H6765_09060 [Candidatus Peribacteria bacterium]|nr:MAG: hypothetical protein H6765_09060 [Candidatus Peribacteria bacterium]